MKTIAFKLHRRIGLMIMAVVLATSGIFTLVAIGIAYSVEDQLFVRALDEEVRRQQNHWKDERALTAPQLGYISIYRQQAELPAELRRQIVEEPQQVEFAGRNGRHYHVVPFLLTPDEPSSSAYAVAEVSRFLVVRPNLQLLLQFLAILGSVIAAMMGLVGFLLAKRSLRPLGQLAREVTVTGSAVPSIDAADYPANEIGMLAARLSQAFERIRQFVAREQAFTRDASHELRTPIAVVRGAAEVLGLEPNLPLPSKNALRRIETATQDMAEALDLLLALARERDVQEWEPTLLSPLVEKAVADTVIRFPDHGLQIEIKVNPELEALVRPRLLQLVLNNLIANSFQHSKATILTISSREHALVIADNGKGLWEGNDPFEPYAKEEGSHGSGLGLDIVRRLCAVDEIDLVCRPGIGDFGVEFILTFNR